MIRKFNTEDIKEQNRIYDLFYKENEHPHFENYQSTTFTILDRLGQVISIGGVRPILEVVAITDMNQSVRNRRMALLDILQTSMFTASKCGYKELHAFTHANNSWDEYLTEVGFKKTDNKVLILDL